MMPPARSARLLMGLAALGALALGTLAVETWLAPPRHLQREEFHRLVGGLGLGPALHLDGCAFGMDSRLEECCSAGYAPLPGGACLCPRHGGGAWSQQGGGDAPLP
ncbi:MAG: hypothetical protein U0840_00345 [Gemmataceae bacterium]